MKQIRNGIFETNSSSTHSLVFSGENIKYYTDDNDKIIVNFVDTNDVDRYTTLSEKVSYLVSHIAQSYRYSADDISEIYQMISEDYEFLAIKNYVKSAFHKEVVLPKESDPEYTSIDSLYLNHQLLFDSVREVIGDMIVTEFRDRVRKGDISLEKLLKVSLEYDNFIEIGRD